MHLLSDPGIESRSDAVLNGDPSVGLTIRSAVETLVALGADVVAVPCNTAHHFIDEFHDEVFRDRVTLAHIVEATLDQLQDRGHHAAWLLATLGTVQSGVYNRHAEARGLAIYLPDPASQRTVDECIEAVKAGNLPAAARKAARLAAHLTDLPLIAGCTELPLAFDAVTPRPRPYISSIDALVVHTIGLLTTKTRSATPQVWN